MTPADLDVTTLDLDAVRSHFPGLATSTVLLENAGGSQVPSCVIDAMGDYMRSRYVQLGAGYAESRAADATVDDAHAFVNLLMNGVGRGEVVLGPSTSQLMAMLAAGYSETLGPGDEVVVDEAGHEANVGPWVRLAERTGATLRVWRVDPELQAGTLDGLESVLGERTRIVAVAHVSNLLGGIVDVAAVAQRVHAANPQARVVVDGVAFAPHRAIDVAAWDVDYYVYSTYKVYGPHMAALWGRHEALAEVVGPNHFFIPRDELPYALELGGVCHEGCAGLPALGDYLRVLAELGGGEGREACDRAVVEEAFGVMEAAERPLARRLLEHLGSRADVRIVGPSREGPARVGTVSFVHARRTSAELVAAAHAAGIGIRHGHMYAHRLCTALGLPPEDGVVRISLLHYNTPDEIERCLAALDPLL